MNHQDSLPISEQNKTSNNKNETKDQPEDLEAGNTQANFDQENAKEPAKQFKQQQSYNVNLNENSKNSQLNIRKKRRMDPTGGQRPCYCFYEDYDKEFLQDIQTERLKKQGSTSMDSKQNLYMAENESYSDYHFIGYYYGPICPCFTMCDCCKNIVSKNTARLDMLGGGGDSQMCCCGLFDQSDTCCKMMVDAWFYLICLPIRIIVETYKSLVRICCQGDSVGQSLSQANCCDQCCTQVFDACSGFWNCLGETCGKVCAPCSNCFDSCMGTECMQSMMECCGCVCKALIQVITVPCQALIIACTAFCSRVIVPCCDCLVRNGDICCEMFRCLG